ncbi:MAG: hypothetical protein GXO02_05115, partial [Epsilonproteobacteria bacterium]|nr:hypothetical protein [Campylobacterota bacterium]
MKIFRIFFISILLFSYLLAGELIKIEIFGLKHLNKEKLLEQIGAKEDDSFIFWRKEGYWIDRKFLEMLKPTIKGWLEENGYYKAKIDIEKSKDLVKVYIKENRPIRVKEIKVDSDIDVTNIVTFKVGDIFSAKKFIDIKGKLKEYLLNKGYCNYKLDTKAYVDLEKFSAKLRYFIRHNDICHFGKTTIIKKPKNIPDRVIYSRLYMQKGKKFTLERIKKSYEALNSLNLFSQIDITYDKNGSIIYPKVAVEKNSKLKRYMLAFGYESEVGFRFKGEHEWRNFLGWRNLKIKMEISKDVQKYEANYFEPAFFAIDNKYFFDLYSSLGYIKEDVSGYFMKKFYWDLHLKYNYERWDVKAGVGFEKLILDLKEEIPNLIDGNFYILYPYIQLTYDARDSKIDPK